MAGPRRPEPDELGDVDERDVEAIDDAMTFGREVLKSSLAGYITACFMQGRIPIASTMKDDMARMGATCAELSSYALEGYMGRIAELENEAIERYEGPTTELESV